jgi:hypothetical protein
MTSRTARASFAAAFALLSVSPAFGAPRSQEPTPRSATSQTARPIVSDEALARIREGLSQPAVKVISESRLRFYALILAQEPTIEQIIGKYDLRYGPTRGGNPMSHQEFLNMVTPRELYGSGGIQAYELLQFSLVNWAGQAIVKRGIEALQKAQSEREVQEIRDRIDRELDALRRRSGGG